MSKRTIRGVAAALVLVVVAAVAGLTFAATTGLTISAGGSGQQGAVTVSGDCQTSPLTVEFQPGAYEGGSFVYDSILVSGIDAACDGGSVAVVHAGSADTAALAVSSGSATVDLTPFGIPVGEIDEVAIALFAPA